MSESQLSEMGFPALEQNPGADSPAPSAGPSAGGFKKRAKTSSLQKSLRKPAPSVPTISVSDDDLDDDDSDEEQSRQSSGVIAGKKRKRGGLLQAASTRKSTKEEIGVIYDVNQSSGSQLDPKSQATAVSAEFSDAELLGRTKTAPVEGSSDNMYRGQNAYRTLIPKREQITTKYNAMGPQKSASNIRMTTYTDYAPDVCKDYKLTGYCGFGDNCKFLHDRGDYKAGWQIDRDWEIEQQKKNDPLLVADDSDSDDDDMNNVPFVCLICREDYEDPVVTKCGHYFCMTCAIKRYKKTPNCIVCGTGTMGIFNKARDFEKKIEAKKSRKEERERRKQGLDQEDEDAEGSNEPDVEGEMVDLD